MLSCSKCKKRSECSVICDKVEKVLPKPTSGRINNKDRSYDPSIIDGLMKSCHKTAVRVNDNWEIK